MKTLSKKLPKLTLKQQKSKISRNLNYIVSQGVIIDLDILQEYNRKLVDLINSIAEESSQFMLKEEDILDISTVYTFCINIIPQRKLKQRRPDDIFMMPRIKGIRNIKQEIKRKHNSEKSI